jgi:hypothetical protein
MIDLDRRTWALRLHAVLTELHQLEHAAVMDDRLDFTRLDLRTAATRLARLWHRTQALPLFPVRLDDQKEALASRP